MHVRRPLSHVHLQPEAVQILRHLQPDETGTDHQRRTRLPLANQCLDALRIRDIAKSQHTRQINTRHIRAERCRPGGEHQLVVRHRLLFSGLEIAHHEKALVLADGDGFVPQQHLDTEALAEQFGRRLQQIPLLRNHLADVIRQPAVGEGDVGAALNQHNTAVVRQTAQARGNGGSARNASDNDRCFHGHLV